MASEQDAAKTWLQVRFVCDAGTAAALAECFGECGALAVSLDDAEDDPIYEPPPGSTPLWSHTRVSALFSAQMDSAWLLAELARRLAPARLPAAELDVLEDREWVGAFQEGFEPLCFGERLWLLPSWTDAPPMTAHQVAVTLDPGLAFGSGSHPTTRMCLHWLAGAALRGKSVVDYGCGSGILAVAAVKLGARRVWAVDNDPQALQATRRNAACNAVDELIEVHEPHSLPTLSADVVVSNILANTLSDLAGTLSGLLAAGGRLALAGILARQSKQVLESYAPWCALHTAARCEDWVLLAGTRKSPGD